MRKIQARKTNGEERVAFCGGYFGAVRSDAVAAPPAPLTFRVSRVFLSSPTGPGLPLVMGSLLLWGQGPLSPALGTPHSQGVELGPVSLLDLALFDGSKLLQHS